MDLFKRSLLYYNTMGFKDFVTKTLCRLGGKIHVPSKPSVLHVELNNTCNLNCKMCPREHLTRSPQNMNFELYKKIVSEVAELGIPHVRLFLFGEPLLYPKLIDAIRFAKNAGIKYVDFNTNANLLSQEMAHKIADSGLDEIVFSVDGFSKETYESIRIKGNYDKCIKNIEYFLGLLKEENIKMTTLIQTINFDAIKDEIERYKLFWKDKVNLVSIAELNPVHGLVKEVDYSGCKRVICNEAFYKMVVLSNGIVTTCCDDFNGELALGDIHKNTIEEIWNGAKWKKLRTDFTKLNYSEYKICEKCIMSYKHN